MSRRRSPPRGRTCACACGQAGASEVPTPRDGATPPAEPRLPGWGNHAAVSYLEEANGALLHAEYGVVQQREVAGHRAVELHHSRAACTYVQGRRIRLVDNARLPEPWRGWASCKSVREVRDGGGWIR